jgi:hypothetical protein
MIINQCKNIGIILFFCNLTNIWFKLCYYCGLLYVFVHWNTFIMIHAIIINYTLWNHIHSTPNIHDCHVFFLLLRITKKSWIGMCNMKSHNYKIEIKSCKCKYFSHFSMSCLNYYNDIFRHHSKLEMNKTNQPFVTLMATSFYLLWACSFLYSWKL